MSFLDRLTLVAFKLAWWAGAKLPKVILITIFQIFSRSMFRRKKTSVQRLQFNLSRVLNRSMEDGQVSQTSAKSLNNYFRYWAEMFHLRAVSNAEINHLVRIENPELLEDSLSQSRGVLVVAPHAGNWDVAGAAIALAYGGLTTVAERLQPVELFDLFVASRIGRDIEILPHRGGDVPAFEVMAQRLRAGKIVALATDRDLSRSGVPVKFFGYPTRMPSGPARLFKETNCVVLSVELSFEKELTLIKFRGPLEFVGDKEIDTQIMANDFEEIIKTHPDHWFMLQQIWLDHPVEFGGRK